MKKIILAVFITLLTSTTLFAQEEIPEEIDSTAEIEVDEEKKTVKSSNKYFDLELHIGSQKSLSKKIPVTLFITPQIDSSKTQILWNIPTTFDIEKGHSEFVSLTQGVTYSYNVFLTPKREGRYNVSVNVIAWQYDTNKSNSVGQNIELNKSLVVQPTSTGYIGGLLAFIAGILAVSVLFVLLIIKGVKILTKKAKGWLTPPT